MWRGYVRRLPHQKPRRRLAPIGGYIAGKKECVENAGVPPDLPGAWKRGRRVPIRAFVLLSGLFLAPTVTAGALKGAIFAANLYEKLGFGVVPNGSEPRFDIIQAVEFGTPEGLISFCEGIQYAALWTAS